MICKNCSKRLPDGTRFCPACGAEHDVTGYAAPIGTQNVPQVNTGLTTSIVFSVLSYVLGGGISLITGVIAMIYAAMAKTHLQDGNAERAQKDAGVARTLNIVTIVLFSLRVVFVILFIVLYASLFAAALLELPLY